LSPRTKALSSLTGLVWLVWPEGPAINGWAILKKSPRNERFGHVAEENKPDCGRYSTENGEEPDFLQHCGFFLPFPQQVVALIG
jgi:hypothetical protein